MAINDEAFVIFWDNDKNDLWLASPSLIRWHHLPESGRPSNKVVFAPDIKADLTQDMPEPFREAVARWHFRQQGDIEAAGK